MIWKYFIEILGEKEEELDFDEEMKEEPEKAESENSRKSSEKEFSTRKSPESEIGRKVSTDSSLGQKLILRKVTGLKNSTFFLEHHVITSLGNSVRRQTHHFFSLLQF